MALAEVKAYFKQWNMEGRIMELESALFGLPQKMSVYLDVSLQRFQDVIPAAGSHNSSIKLSIKELTRFSDTKG
jgi:hypothetical protein